MLFLLKYVLVMSKFISLTNCAAMQEINFISVLPINTQHVKSTEAAKAPCTPPENFMIFQL